MHYTLAILMTMLPANESKILSRVAQDYHLTPEQTVLLGAIRREESGGPGKEMGVEIPKAQRYRRSPSRSLLLQGRYAAGTIRGHYTGDLHAFAVRWCPLNVTSWEHNVRSIMSKTKI